MKEKTLRGAASSAAIGLVTLLSGCSNLDILNPKGSVGVAERDLIATSTWAMLIVVIPVIVLTLLFAWRYRASNKSAEYRPNWSHSTGIEIAVWTIPTLIILFLGVLTWKSTHELDPYRPLESSVKPINVEVVALDWKWLFIYPDLGIASVNQLAIPVGTPVNFNITSDSVMNSFFIPQLGGQIYAMAGMQTKLHLIADEAGDYAGESANFSGKGFSDMKFRALAASSDSLDMNRYNVVSQPGEKAPVTYFSSVDPKLFHNIIARYNNGNVMDLKDASNCKAKG
jgi:cytochrome o ubiquinol oxidase subunit 2